MKNFLGWIRWASPWVALGLAAALVAVYLRPELLQDPGAGTGAGAPEPAQAPPSAAPAAPGETAAAPPAAAATETSGSLVSYADAVETSAPAVVNVYTERVVRVPAVRGVPPGLAPYFGDMWNSYRERVERSLGSGVISPTSTSSPKRRRSTCSFATAARRRPNWSAATGTPTWRCCASG